MFVVAETQLVSLFGEGRIVFRFCMFRCKVELVLTMRDVIIDGIGGPRSSGTCT